MPLDGSLISLSIHLSDLKVGQVIHLGRTPTEKKWRAQVEHRRDSGALSLMFLAATGNTVCDIVEEEGGLMRFENPWTGLRSSPVFVTDIEEKAPC